jgi:glutamyl-tRNA synthetase
MAALVKEIIETPTSYDEKAVKKAFKEGSIEVLNAFGAKITSAEELHLPSDYHHLMQEVVDEMKIGFGKIGQPLRVALLGKMAGPGLDSVMAIIGKDETMLRIANAITAHS